MSGRLEAIAIRSGPRQPMEVRGAAFVSPASGVEGDWRGKPGDRQATVLFEADWAAACAEVGGDHPWTVRRANFLLSGLSNPGAAGGVLRIGAVELLITGETEPCSRMDAQVSGLRAALTPDWRGGLTARVLNQGEVRVGDAAEWAG